MPKNMVFTCCVYRHIALIKCSPWMSVSTNIKKLFQSRNFYVTKNHPGRFVTHVQHVSNGFKKKSIWLVNPDIFPDYMFEPADTTNIPLNQENIADSTPEIPSSHLPLIECLNTSSIQEDPSNNVPYILSPSAINDDEVNSSQNTMQTTTNADIGVVVSDVINLNLVTSVEEFNAVEVAGVAHVDGVRPGTSKQSLTFSCYYFTSTTRPVHSRSRKKKIETCKR
ncbi:unnamed protein product [Euphydryas editha]|uniref:Uncharacterized protein n=1 Tax=Euphydryas editha TaxID=104508 RepID=A0AAU9UGX2_EUPED|nr:unnamed protein product [Euphydryas editha]